MISRRAARTIARKSDGMAVRSAGVFDAAQLQSEKVQAVCAVGTSAMQSVAMMSQIEGQLAAAVPLATSRLQGIADITAAAAAAVVVDTTEILRRI
jgi:hypothetical protein